MKPEELAAIPHDRTFYHVTRVGWVLSHRPICTAGNRVYRDDFGYDASLAEIHPDDCFGRKRDAIVEARIRNNHLLTLPSYHSVAGEKYRVDCARRELDKLQNIK